MLNGTGRIGFVHRTEGPIPKENYEDATVVPLNIFLQE